MKNEAIFPTFILNKKLVGFLHVLVGAVPKEYHWLVEMAGMDGTVPQGTSELMDLGDHIEGTEFSCYRDELLFISVTFTIPSRKMKLTEKKKILERMLPAAQQSPLIRYCYANVAMKMGKNEDALEVLNQPISVEGVFSF